MGVAALILGTFINVLYVVSAAGDGVWHTRGPNSGGDLKTGTAEMSVDGCSSSSPVEMQGFFGGMAVTFLVLGEGLPIPGTDFFEDFPLLTLAVGSLELVNSLQVPLGGLEILPFITGCLDPMWCLVLILLV